MKSRWPSEKGSGYNYKDQNLCFLLSLAAAVGRIMVPSVGEALWDFFVGGIVAGGGVYVT
jgi:hypothetical protein